MSAPYVGPTSCPINSALFFEVARTLATARNSESWETRALVAPLMREFVKAGSFREDEIGPYLDMFDPVLKEEEAKRSGGQTKGTLHDVLAVVHR